VGFVKEIRDGEVLLEIATSSAEVSDHMPTSGFTAEIFGAP